MNLEKLQFIQVNIEQISQGCIAHIVLNRPQVHNAFHPELIDELTSAAQYFQQDPFEKPLRLITLRGSGKSFSAGADLNWMKSLKDYSYKENVQDSQKLATLFRTLDGLSLPLLGLVNGAAYGGGTGLMSVCDFVLTCESAKFGFTETKLGLIPAVISPYVIKKIGYSHARAWFLSGAIFSAEQAMQMGLVHKVVADDQFEQNCQQLIQSFLQAGPLAAAEAKLFTKRVRDKIHQHESLWGEYDETLFSSELEAYTCETIARLRVTDEAQQGMQSLLQKQKAPWVVD